MGRPKKKRSPARRRKSVNEGSAPVDRSDPATWGPREGPVKKVGKSTLLQMYEQGGLSAEQLRAADLIYRVHALTTAFLRPVAVDLNKVGSAPKSTEPEWYCNAWPIYRKWRNSMKQMSVEKVIVSIVLEGRTIAETAAALGLSRDKIKSHLKNALSVFVKLFTSTVDTARPST